MGIRSDFQRRAHLACFLVFGLASATSLARGPETPRMASLIPVPTTSASPAIVIAKNVSRALFLPSIEDPEPKSAVVRRLGKLRSAPLSAAEPPLDRRLLVLSNYHALATELPDKYYVGAGGASPCIGVIIVTPEGQMGDRTIFAFHFGALDNPYRTLENQGPFPAGSHVALFGGNGSKESNLTLQAVMRYFDSNRISSRAGQPDLVMDGYSDTTGLWVDRAGHYFTFRLDGPSPDQPKS